MYTCLFLLFLDLLHAGLMGAMQLGLLDLKSKQRFPAALNEKDSEFRVRIHTSTATKKKEMDPTNSYAVILELTLQEAHIRPERCDLELLLLLR